MWWAAAVTHQVVTPVSPGASRHMLTAEAVVWKEGDVKEQPVEMDVFTGEVTSG